MNQLSQNLPSDTTAPNTGTSGGLRRTLSYFDLVAYGLAYMAVVAPLTNLGFVWDASGGLIASAYVVAAICMYFTAQSYASMSAEVPSCGSVYGFARASLGELAGFMAGWLILLDYLLSPALVFALMAVGMSTLVPGVDRAVWIILVVSVTLILSWFGAKVGARVSALSVAAQFVIVGAVLVLAWFALRSGLGNRALTAQPFVGAAGPDWHRIFSGATIAVMVFLGFDAVSTLSEEVRGDNRNTVGRATLTVLGIASGLYVLVAWVMGNLMPAIQLQDPAAAIFELLGQTVGPWAPELMAWLLALAVGLTNALPMQAGVSRVLFAMGRSRQLPAVLGRAHAGSGVPRAALLLATTISLTLALVLRDRIELLASLISFGALAGFALLHLSVMVHFARQPARRRTYMHVVSPVLGLIVVAVMLTAMHPTALTVGVCWLGAGLAYGFFLHLRGRAALTV
ncbi:MAG TPA: APC family permease [Burkholderiaceae bacterium]|nr:APC family permease [Burkholderiaceae bacterium]